MKGDLEHMAGAHGHSFSIKSGGVKPTMGMSSDIHYENQVSL